MILAVACGGALGALGRHLLGLGALQLFGPAFPWGTLAANVIGSFAMGVLVEFGALRLSVSNEWRGFFAVGLLGGFTTFSAFALDVALLTGRQAELLALLYAAASVVLSIGALFAGMRGVRRLLA
jgi:CrcB protein